MSHLDLIDFARATVEAYRARSGLTGAERRQSVAGAILRLLAQRPEVREQLAPALAHAVFEAGEALVLRAELDRLRGVVASLRGELDRLDLDAKGFEAEWRKNVEDLTAREVEISRLRGLLAERDAGIPAAVGDFTPPVRPLVPVDTADEVKPAPRKGGGKRAKPETSP